MKIRIEDKYDAEKEVRPYSTEAPDEVAHFAMQLIQSHAMVAGIEDGEDNTGRAKLRIQTPEELVRRSFRIAELTFETARQRGHMVSLPDLNDLNAEYDADREEKRRVKREREAALNEQKRA